MTGRTSHQFNIVTPCNQLFISSATWDSVLRVNQLLTCFCSAVSGAIHEDDEWPRHQILTISIMTRNGALVSYLPSWDVFLLATEGAQGNGEVGIETVIYPPSSGTSPRYGDPDSE